MWWQLAVVVALISPSSAAVAATNGDTPSTAAEEHVREEGDTVVVERRTETTNVLEKTDSESNFIALSFVSVSVYAAALRLLECIYANTAWSDCDPSELMRSKTIRLLAQPEQPGCALARTLTKDCKVEELSQGEDRRSV